MSCWGGLDDNGCPIPDMCIPAYVPGPAILFTSEGLDCPNVCPAICPPDMMACPAGIDAVGCPVAGTCMPIGTRTECPQDSTIFA